MTKAPEFNLVVSVREGCFKQTKSLLRDLGRVHTTDYYNVLTLQTDDAREAMEVLRAWCEIDPAILDWLGHVVPVDIRLEFQSPEEFETRAREALLQWLPRLADNSFHVRMHRRGFKGRLEGAAVERLLGETILAGLREAGTPARVTFDDPDVIVLIETLGQHAGLALITREDLRRYPFIHLAD